MQKLYNLRPQNILTVTGNETIPLHSVPYSQSTLISMIGPSECNEFGFGQGGPAMKSMDTVAGIVAFRHCRTNVVTVSLGKYVPPVSFHCIILNFSNVSSFLG